MKLTKLTNDIYTLTDSNKDEEATVILFYLFPGVILGINDIHMKHIIGNSNEVNKVVHTDYLRINYCLEGRCEVKLKDGRYVYVENDALTLDKKLEELRFISCQLLYYLVNHQAVNETRSYRTSFLSHGQYMIATDCEQKITEDLSRKWTIADLAQHYKISPSSLKKFFSQVYGCSISEYLQTMRMKEAARLLTEENYNVMYTSAAVGYENQSKFSAVFKKHTGYAPLEYKRINTIKRSEETT